MTRTRREINREKIQDYAVYLSKEFKHVVLSWATGCGKSLAAIRIINEWIEHETKEKGDWNLWYIVCAEKQHMKNWTDEFNKHGYGKLLELGYVRLFCYQSLHKYKDTKANLILDEAHGVTDLRLDILQTITADKIISLSATLTSERASQLGELSPFKEYPITTDEAIKADILPKPIIVKVETILDGVSRMAYEDICDKINQLEGKKKQLLIAEINPFESSVIQVLQQQKQELLGLDGKILRNKIRRKRLLSNAKTSHIEKLIVTIKKTGKRFVAFTGTIEQCKKLGDKAGISVHSDHTDKENSSRIHKFNTKELDALICLKMLRQGTNLEAIDMGIIAQLDSKELSFVQMMGRIFRSTRPVLFVYTVRDSVDDIYWEECSKGLDPSYIISLQDYLSNYHGKDS